MVVQNTTSAHSNGGGPHLQPLLQREEEVRRERQLRNRELGGRTQNGWRWRPLLPPLLSLTLVGAASARQGWWWRSHSQGGWVPGWGWVAPIPCLRLRLP
jgi:hypothetical protein